MYYRGQVFQINALKKLKTYLDERKNFFYLPLGSWLAMEPEWVGVLAKLPFKKSELLYKGQIILSHAVVYSTNIFN